MNRQKIGQLILMLRNEKTLTQKQLTEQLHVSDRTISKWERGIGYPDIAILPKLSRAQEAYDIFGKRTEPVFKITLLP